MRVTELKPRNQSASVSWTGKGVSYYIHVVDRRRVRRTMYSYKTILRCPFSANIHSSDAI